jgi:hypothetical protein
LYTRKRSFPKGSIRLFTPDERLAVGTGAVSSCGFSSVSGWTDWGSPSVNDTDLWTASGVYKQKYLKLVK